MDEEEDHVVAVAVVVLGVAVEVLVVVEVLEVAVEVLVVVEVNID